MRVPDEEFSIKQRVMRTKLDIYALAKDKFKHNLMTNVLLVVEVCGPLAKSHFFNTK